MSEGESKKKHVALLDIHKEKFRLKPIPLQTVRPFVMANVTLADEAELEGADPSAVMDFLERKVLIIALFYFILLTTIIKGAFSH